MGPTWTTSEDVETPQTCSGLHISNTTLPQSSLHNPPLHQQRSWSVHNLSSTLRQRPPLHTASMKVFFLATAFLTAAVSARATFFGSSSSAVTPFDDDDDLLNVPGDNPLRHCADPSDDLLILESVDLDPNPPQAGKTLTVTAKGNLTETVEEGAKVHLQVKYGLITIINQTADLCKTVKNVNLTCPVEEGETEITKEVSLPSHIPPGKYSVIADVFTKDEEKITCLQATVEFKRGGSVLYKQGL